MARYSFVITFILSLFFLGCQQTRQHQVRVAADKMQIAAGQRAHIHSSLYLKGNKVTEQPGTFTYKVKHGQIENGIYQAPAQPGTDELTISHSASEVTKVVPVQVVAGPRIVLSQESYQVGCGERLALSPQLFIGTQEKETTAGEFEYYAQQGSFAQNVYLAPEQEVVDTLQVIYPPLGLEKRVTVSVKATPILYLEAPDEVFVTEKVQLDPHLRKLGERVAASLNEFTLTAQRGSVSGKSYLAPEVAGEDTITVSHASGQKLSHRLVVKRNISLQIEAPKQLAIYRTVRVTPLLLKSGQAREVNLQEFLFSAQRGSFRDGNLYQAPALGGEELITLTHKPSGAQATHKLTIVSSAYRPVETDYFKIEVPSDWQLLSKDMGFVATSHGGEYRWDQVKGAEIKALALSGFDFLDPKTVMVLFQQQGGMGKLEKISEEPFNFNGHQATRVVFQSSSGKPRKSWWLILKKNGIVYLFTISGFLEFFQKPDSVPNRVISSFELKERTVADSENLQIDTSSLKKVDAPFFSLEVPPAWKWGTLFGILFASSETSKAGKKFGFFVLSYRSREMEGIDPELILLLIRQEIIKDPSMVVTEEKDIEFAGLQAKMIEFSAQKEALQASKMWIIALKHNFTGYAIIINAPTALWQANPKLPMEILDTFNPK